MQLFFERPSSADERHVVGDRVIDERAFERVRRRWRRFTLIVIYSVKFYTTLLPHTHCNWWCFCVVQTLLPFVCCFGQIQIHTRPWFCLFCVQADSILFKSHSCNFKKPRARKLKFSFEPYSIPASKQSCVSHSSSFSLFRWRPAWFWFRCWKTGMTRYTQNKSNQSIRW